MRIGNNKTLSPRSHSEVFFHDESCTPSDCTPMRTAIRKRPHPPRRGRVLSERPFQPASVAHARRLHRSRPRDVPAVQRRMMLLPPLGSPLPACELNNLLPERPAAAAEGGWTALRGALATPDGTLRPPSAADSGSKTGLFAGCCCPGAAPCAHGAPRRRVERAAWPIPSAASAAAPARRMSASARHYWAARSGVRQGRQHFWRHFWRDSGGPT